uniref:Cytochrome c oxidase assembly protein COX11, mitochondrial n=1 Tax=Panagrellus redivivus TaxID=6233 RepID=A0A7E4V0Z8_PANRE
MSLSVPEIKLTTAKTEYGRNKVALQPGKGLAGWIMLSAGKSLASVQLPSVDNAELMKHNKEDDCWILLFGTVYDITKYMEYHPGGIPELMRAAGTDAGDLFNQYHAWINYQNLLKACIVGPFRGNASKLPRPTNPIFEDNPATKSGNSEKSVTLDAHGFSITRPDPKTLALRANIGSLLPENVIIDTTSKKLRIVFRRYDSETISVTYEGYDWSDRSFTVKSVSPKQVNVAFPSEASLKDVRVLQSTVSLINDPHFYSVTVQSIDKLSHNTFKYVVKLPEALYLPIPTGHHLLLRVPGGLVERPFTPISTVGCLGSIEFFVKIYPDGALTQKLEGLSIGDTLEISDPIGRKDVQKVAQKAVHCLLLAAGTGITPMINVLRGRKHSRSADGLPDKLIWFNRTPNDIVLDVLPETANLDIVHCLSDFETIESGIDIGNCEVGRIRKEILRDSIRPNTTVFVCGPLAFNETAVKLLTELGVAAERLIMIWSKLAIPVTRCLSHHILPYTSRLQSPITAKSLLLIRSYASAGPQPPKLSKPRRVANRDSMYYVISIGVVAIGLTFAAIPAYRIFCEATAFGGTTQIAKDFDKIENMSRVEDRLIKVQFNADVPSSMQWNFKPLQDEIYVHPGETALAFYTAKNPTDKPIVGISSYNLTPFQAAYYFNKIQCFCFEEQILNPGEEVDLPVFFYIDPDYANDPNLEYLDHILLSYTFFEAKSNLKLPSPFDPANRPNAALPAAANKGIVATA